MTWYVTCYNPGMETADYIAQITRKGIERIERENQETQDFRGWWGAARQQVEETARKAAQGVKEAHSRCRLVLDRLNGGTKVLFQWHPNQEPVGYLRFDPDPEERRVVCTCSPSDLDIGDTFERDNFTEAVIAHKIGEFLTAIFESSAREIRRKG